MHTIDTIRRDAARQQIRFEIRCVGVDAENLPSKVEIVMNYEQARLIYTIDMQADVIESLTFAGNIEGQLKFDYLQDIDEFDDEFAEPAIKRFGITEKSQGMLWLFDLAKLNSSP